MLSSVIMEKKDLHIRYWVVTVLSYAAFFLALFFLLRGTIRTNFVSGGYRETAEEFIAMRNRTEYEKKDVALWSADGIVISEKEMEKSLSDDTHVLLEALLEGPGPDELSKGLITYIPEGTRLIGVTERDNMYFVALSKDFLDTPDKNRAFEQIKTTLASGRPGIRVALIVDGEIVIS